MKQISNVNQVKNHNVALIKNTLKSIESGTKNTVSQLTGLSVATCNTILNELASTGEIIETAPAAPTIGRPPKSYRFNESFAYVLCLFTFEEGEFTLNSAVTDLLGTIITDDTKSYSKITTNEILEYIAEKIEEEPRIKYISLGISGFYYNKKVQQSGITDINGVDLKSVIENEFGLPCTIENDTNAMAFGVYSFSDKMAECREENKSVALLAYFKGRSRLRNYHRRQNSPWKHTLFGRSKQSCLQDNFQKNRLKNRFGRIRRRIREPVPRKPCA